MTPEVLLAIVGAVLAFVFAYVPGLKTRFDNLSPAYKPLVNAFVIAIVAYAMFGLSCLGYLVYWACTAAGAIEVLQLIILALLANQSAYALGIKLPAAIKAHNK